MEKHPKQVSNPLTIIAIFAGIAEALAAVVLPFVSEQNQLVVLVFLLAFPCLLVVMFFLTLNFNNKVLYAPSDYADEANFVTMMNKQILEVEERLTHTVEKEITEKVSVLEDNLSQIDILSQAKELFEKDQLDDALKVVNTALEVRITSFALILKGMILARMLEYTRAIKCLGEAMDLPGSSSVTLATLYWNRACYKCLDGQGIETIIEDLREAILHNLQLSDRLVSEADLDAVRENPRFREFVDSIRG